jgi:peptidyl-prolyl cis-trans isomerase SurA
MKPGEVSPLLRSPNGFHIIKLLDERGAERPTLVTQTHARQILIKTNQLVSQADAENRLLQLRQKLEHGADFAKLARLYSDDPGAANGGDLGWLSPGNTVPPFEQAMNALKPGEISKPVHTSFGWHLIQVLGRRTRDITKERARMLARRAIHERKSDEAYQNFVRRLRDQAYVEYMDHKQ